MLSLADTDKIYVGPPPISRGEQLSILPRALAPADRRLVLRRRNRWFSCRERQPRPHGLRGFTVNGFVANGEVVAP
jgi:hypothetical protein